MPQLRVGTKKEFEELPVPVTPSKKVSPLMPALDEIRAGKIVFISYSSEKEMRGIRIGLARLAGSDEIKLEFRPKRFDEQTGELAVRVHPTERYIPKPPKPEGERRPVGRPPKIKDSNPDEV